MMTQTVIAPKPSSVVLPETVTDKATVLAFLISHFKNIPAQLWLERVERGKVHWSDGSLITASTPYKARCRVFYYREVTQEPSIPFAEQVLYQDEHCLVAYKPHFLPVHPTGNFVKECLVNRLQQKTGIDTLVPAHRLDRHTAGLVLLSIKPATRDLYHQLFRQRTIKKTYHALAVVSKPILSALQKGVSLPLTWNIENRIVRSEPSFTMKIGVGEPNSYSQISLIAVDGDIGVFSLSPITGKTHQLRLHMQSLGMPILNDHFYPKLLPAQADNFSKPLKLVACGLNFIDPITGNEHDFKCFGYSLEMGLDNR